MRVVWRSSSAPLTGSAAAAALVEYGTQPGVLTSVQDAATTAGAECGEPEGGAVHSAELEGLLPGTTYFYRYGQEVSVC